MYCQLSFFSEVKFAAYLLMGTHIMACIWFLLACSSLTNDDESMNPHSCEVDSWVLNGIFVNKTLSQFIMSFDNDYLFYLLFLMVASYSIGYQYIVSVYWASATTVTVGYGDIHAHTDSEVCQH